MDWQLFFAAAGAGAGVVAAAAPIAWTFLNAILAPIRSDIARLDKRLEALEAKVQPLDYIIQMSQKIVHDHEEKCRDRLDKRIHDAIVKHEHDFHQNN